jgi:hypothetical protein
MAATPGSYDEGTTTVHYAEPSFLYMRPEGSAPFRDSTMEYVPDDDDPPPFEDTWEWYRMRILLWVDYIRSLPWAAPRIVNDYVRETAGRDYRGGRKTMKSRTKESWYKPKQGAQNIEKPVISPPMLFVPPSQAAAYFASTNPSAVPQSAFTAQTPYSEAATAIRPTRTPMTVTSAAMSFPSPGASSHGGGRQAMSYSWYSTSPQEYPWQPSHLLTPPLSPPQVHEGSGYFDRRFR